MDINTKYNIKKIATNTFGVFGYIFCCLQWLWVVLLYFSANQDYLISIFPRTSNHVNTSTTVGFSLSPAGVVFVAIFVIIMLILTVYICIKIPSTIVKTGKNVVTKTAETATPMVIKAMHKKDTKKFHIKITSRLILVMKLLFIVIPIIMIFFFQFMPNQEIDYQIVMIIGYGLACLGLSLYIVQYLLAVLMRIKVQDIY